MERRPLQAPALGHKHSPLDTRRGVTLLRTHSSCILLRHPSHQSPTNPCMHALCARTRHGPITTRRGKHEPVHPLFLLPHPPSSLPATSPPLQVRAQLARFLAGDQDGVLFIPLAKGTVKVTCVAHMGTPGQELRVLPRFRRLHPDVQELDLQRLAVGVGATRALDLRHFGMSTADAEAFADAVRATPSTVDAAALARQTIPVYTPRDRQKATVGFSAAARTVMLANMRHADTLARGMDSNLRYKMMQMLLAELDPAFSMYSLQERTSVQPVSLGFLSRVQLVRGTRS